eukprot:TRINITY_DN35387_c0_g1_i3.p1 TRINITY_DN35387_c0_g1~~TRINITY_DN35387_c0_g1_i3.p1  ORF type:complete len:203 (-),score=46.76 TRINITY_DN35387_c0_g1_i3:59-667(-)
MLIDHFQDESKYYIVLEFPERYDLAEKIVVNGRLSESIAKKYFKELVRGVHVLHYLGCAHRDLSADNVLITQDDEIRIIDFGVVFVKDRGCSSFVMNNNITVGKCAYKSPEASGRDGTYNAVSNDVWSCGMILFYMLTGSLPCRYATAADPNFHLLMAGEFDQLVPEDLVLSAMARDLLSNIFKMEDERISTSQILAHDFLN